MLVALMHVRELPQTAFAFRSLVLEQVVSIRLATANFSCASGTEALRRCFTGFSFRHESVFNTTQHIILVSGEAAVQAITPQSPVVVAHSVE